MPARFETLTNWLQASLGMGANPSTSALRITPASADASFRRYFRVSGTAVSQRFGETIQSLVVMDAPPDKEDIHPFVRIAECLAGIGLNVPRVYAQDFEQGFLLLSDLGIQAYLDALNEHTVESLYGDALNALLVMQRDATKHADILPAYTETLLINEMQLFRDWYCHQYRGFSFTDSLQAEFDQMVAWLSAAALAQPQVFVHRDYHSRNLMVTGQQNPGILDFQDAVIGPVSYDLVSLLRDCYIAWPRPRVEQWALDYLHRAAETGLIPRESDATYLRWFDCMGVQRHLKATGIFARLHLRDNKPGYLGDIPRTLDYVRDVSTRYAELTGLRRLLDELA